MRDNLGASEIFVGDRVRVVNSSSSAYGKFGLVIGFKNAWVVVRSIETGNERHFRSHDVEVQPLQADSLLDAVEVQPLQQEVLELQPVEVQPLQGGVTASAVVEVQPLLSSSVLDAAVEVQPLQEKVLELQPVGAEPLHVELEMLHNLRDRLLREGVLSQCWIETYERGGATVCRLQWHKKLDKPPTYFEPKQLNAYMQKNQRGKALVHVEALIRLLNC